MNKAQRKASPKSNVQRSKSKLNPKSQILTSESTIQQFNYVSLPGTLIMGHLKGGYYVY